MELYCEVTGKGNPIILVHSGGADIRDWEYVAPLLAKQYQVIAFDGRGCGKSPSPTKPVHFVDDLLAIMDHHQLKQATIVGHSIGGRIATEFALTYPNRVTKLVLIAPDLSGYSYGKDYTDWMLKIQAAAPDLDHMMEIALAAPSYSIVMASPQRDLMVQTWRDNIARVFEWGHLEILWPKPPAIERLGSLTVKTCFIIGKEDIADLHRIAEHYREVPDIRFIELEGADHKPTLTHPEEISRHIIEFLED